MKNAGERRRAEAALPTHAEEASDQETKKISASQLAEVLARVDGNRSADGARGERTISGMRPVFRPAADLPTPAADFGPSAPPPSSTAGVADASDDSVVVEFPVDEQPLVNPTSPAEARRSRLVISAPRHPRALVMALFVAAVALLVVLGLVYRH